jgi:hypothetical protein
MKNKTAISTQTNYAARRISRETTQSVNPGLAIKLGLPSYPCTYIVDAELAARLLAEMPKGFRVRKNQTAFLNACS